MTKLDAADVIQVVGGTGTSTLRSVSSLETGEPSYSQTYNKTCWWTYTPATSGLATFAWTVSIPGTGGITLWKRASGTGPVTYAQLVHEGFTVAVGGDHYVTAGVTYYIQGAASNINSELQGTITGPNSVPLTVYPNLSTLTDHFSSLDSAKWTVLNPWSLSPPPVACTGGALVLGNQTHSGIVETAQLYRFDSAQVKINAAGKGMQLRVADNNDYLGIEIQWTPTWHVRAFWSIGGTTGDSGDDTAYDIDAHKYLKITRGTNAATFSTSANGYDWNVLHQVGLATDNLVAARASIIGNLSTSVDTFNIVVPTPGTAPETTPSMPDMLPVPVPDTTAPPLGTDPDADPQIEVECSTVIDLIRQFSAQIKAPVRIVGPNTIEVVDINAPLPTGWTVADAATLYSRTTQELIAGERVLSMESDLLAINVSADLVADDMTLVLSDWQIPGQLPIYGLVAGLVKRVSYVFTPTRFTASVDFHIATVPASLRRS